MYQLNYKDKLDELEMYTSELMDLAPNRREGQYYMARYFMVTKQTHRAASMIQKLIQNETPHDGILWKNAKIYDNKHINNVLNSLK